MFSKFTQGMAIALLVGVFAVGTATEVSANADQINYRKAVMKGVGGAMGGLKAVVQGKVSASNAPALADAMASFAAVTGGAFPKGSGGDKTRAKDEVWSKPAEFKAAVDAFQKAATNLAAVASSGGDLKAAFGALGKTCGGCHKPFRKPKS